MPAPDRSDGTAMGAAVLEMVAQGLSGPVLDRLAPGSTPRPYRVSTALGDTTTHNLLGTRCDLELHGPPDRLTARGHADHVLGLPDAGAVLVEGIRRYDGRRVLLLLPLDTPYTQVREQRLGALAGARYGHLEVTALAVPGHALLGTVQRHASLLHDAVAATRLGLARLLSDLARQAVCEALAHAQRRPFQDGVLAGRQAFGHAVAEAAAAVRMCHAVTRRAATASGPARWDRAVRAGAFVARAVPQSVGTACRLLGGQGFMDGHPMAAAYREAVFAPVLLGGQQRLVDSMRQRLAGEASPPTPADGQTPTDSQAQAQAQGVGRPGPQPVPVPGSMR
ncbi:acyl-CoA dehydrogenase family protein [Streptomyces rishiriensis]|uniref:Acyl-CoA dehydrogenase/oxidase C-terminal domain-containing protein n=1 Tax=Streptomyces rishiriensis TaxID=68264 RepID=A0ABU0P513_STRRH|nr:acyl-CoA dehydrogenase family protein [Streptomyces rishiriensis]MDQ0585820.1 hypothetical protein [Streptomyces rishiriensis]